MVYLWVDGQRERASAWFRVAQNFKGFMIYSPTLVGFVKAYGFDVVPVL